MCVFVQTSKQADACGAEEESKTAEVDRVRAALAVMERRSELRRIEELRGGSDALRRAALAIRAPPSSGPSGADDAASEGWSGMRAADIAVQVCCCCTPGGGGVEVTLSHVPQVLEAERAQCVDTLTALCARHSLELGLASDEELAPAPPRAAAAAAATAAAAGAAPSAATPPLPVAPAAVVVPASGAEGAAAVATAPAAAATAAGDDDDDAAASGAGAVAAVAEVPPAAATTTTTTAGSSAPDVPPAAVEAPAPRAAPAAAEVGALRAAYAGHVTEEHEIDAAVERAAASEDFEQAEVCVRATYTQRPSRCMRRAGGDRSLTACGGCVDA